VGGEVEPRLCPVGRELSHNRIPPHVSGFRRILFSRFSAIVSLFRPCWKNLIRFIFVFPAFFVCNFLPFGHFVNIFCLFSHFPAVRIRREPWQDISARSPVLMGVTIRRNGGQWGRVLTFLPPPPPGNWLQSFWQEGGGQSPMQPTGRRRKGRLTYYHEPASQADRQPDVSQPSPRLFQR